MTAAEAAIFAFFRRYQIGPCEMLFFNPCDCKLPEKHFDTAMQSLLRRGLVTKERPKAAYSLTQEGYDKSRLLSRRMATLKRARRNPRTAPNGWKSPKGSSDGP